MTALPQSRTLTPKLRGIRACRSSVAPKDTDARSASLEPNTNLCSIAQTAAHLLILRLTFYKLL